MYEEMLKENIYAVLLYSTQFKFRSIICGLATSLYNFSIKAILELGNGPVFFIYNTNLLRVSENTCTTYQVILIYNLNYTYFYSHSKLFIFDLFKVHKQTRDGFDETHRELETLTGKFSH